VFSAVCEVRNPSCLEGIVWCKEGRVNTRSVVVRRRVVALLVQLKLRLDLAKLATVIAITVS